MAKKKDNHDSEEEKPSAVKDIPIDPSLPKEAQEKLKHIRDRVLEFQKQVVQKFDKYIMGVALLPPPKSDDKEANKDAINILVLIDDSDSQKMSKEELKEKLSKIISKIGKDLDKNIESNAVIISELWQSCYDAKYDLLQLIAMCAPVYDKGMLQAIKIAEIHKTMVLKKFEKYIVAYVLAGSLTQGRATEKSDIDVFVVIDDTDVKKMTRAELKDKLRAIIIGMGIEAGEMTGIRNKLNIQVYILTDFWENIREANPVMFTFLRDGVPFYDRGIFMPWKQLLQMGKIKPSPEAIDLFMGSGDQMLKRVRYKIKEIGMEDTYWAILTPSQAALMLFGVPPPTPKETPQLMREIFVKKHKMLEDNFVKILEKNLNIRKKLEHGEQKELSGKEVDELIDGAEKYLERIDKLFEEIRLLREKENVLASYDTTITVVRDLLRIEGVDKIDDKDVEKAFETHIVNRGIVPEKYSRLLKEMMKAKSDYENDKLTKTEIENVKKKSRELVKYLVEYMQRKRGKELERTKIRIKHGDKYGEVLLLDNDAFIIEDVDAEEKKIMRAPIKKDGSLGPIKDATIEELEEHLAKIEIPSKVFIKQPIFENLKKVYGKDVEILINY